MAKVSLDLSHLQYILAQLPVESDTTIGKQARSIIEKSISSIHRSNESQEFQWFYDPHNQDEPLKKFIRLPMSVQLLHVSEFFGEFSDPVYIRVINALEGRNCQYIHHLMALTIFQISCTRRLGDRSHLAILRALEQKKEPLC
ncbi:hypothetical protein [Paenibacillus xylanilyticus]|uniref:Uncharacterized protein n=1 Tax=Paenibacillus xylanilyticus TaxID=248903 RepID=A0A7Y6BUM2_9BACL|nr:hypothetical protein [Paenibacillus xylanilyticus]NUU75328.1 hypothetical protein [Paenibacillus xylanilyticus]